MGTICCFTEKTVEVCPLPSMMHASSRSVNSAIVVIKDSSQKQLVFPEYSDSHVASIVREEFLLRPAFGPQLIQGTPLHGTKNMFLSTLFRYKGCDWVFWTEAVLSMAFRVFLSNNSITIADDFKMIGLVLGTFQLQFNRGIFSIILNGNCYALTTMRRLLRWCQPTDSCIPQ
ncbi:hypothetical protein CEXT_93371 [Caerostris extrusa]|uniref:Uncharacterized protein n=1 Tax=Caerostris extrusa TaxID=172846 RepID=A0AAV4VLM5_CAEEX|nr:hypothetical protein CEXT_93371 [Caerostris extrusa]